MERWKAVAHLEGTHQITCWTSPSCASSLPSFAGSGTSLIQRCFPGLHQLHGLDSYPQLEISPEMLHWLAAISQVYDYAWYCLPHVWPWSSSPHDHTSWMNAHHTHFPVMLSWEEGPAWSTH